MCGKLAITKFGEVRVDKIISQNSTKPPTRVVLNVIHKVKKTLSYVTTGQKCGRHRSG